ncbi:MAG: hypothetical protein R3B40_22545 [Polyangiales bacterium]|nr:hypothetical protein [Sandaracinaceae bacterium]
MFEAERLAFLDAVIARLEAVESVPARRARSDDAQWPEECGWVDPGPSPEETVVVSIQGSSFDDVELSDIYRAWDDDNSRESAHRDPDAPRIRFSLVDPSSWQPAIDQRLVEPPVFGGEEALGRSAPGPVAWQLDINGAEVSSSAVRDVLEVVERRCQLTPELPVELLLGFDRRGRLTRGEPHGYAVFPPATLMCIDEALHVAASEGGERGPEVSRVGVTSNVPYSPSVIEADPAFWISVNGPRLSPAAYAALASCLEGEPRIDICAEVDPTGAVRDVDVSDPAALAPRVMVALPSAIDPGREVRACLNDALRGVRFPCSREGGVAVLARMAP